MHDVCVKVSEILDFKVIFHHLKQDEGPNGRQSQRLVKRRHYWEESAEHPAPLWDSLQAEACAAADVKPGLYEFSFSLFFPGMHAN